MTDKAIMLPISDDGDPFEIGDCVAFNNWDSSGIATGSAFMGIIRAIDGLNATVEFCDTAMQPTGNTCIRPLSDLREYMMPGGEGDAAATDTGLSPINPTPDQLAEVGTALVKTIDVSDYSTSVKMIGEDRIGGYLVVWGNATQKDLTGEYFTKSTEGLTELFGELGKLPILYHHGANDALKATLVGMIDSLEPDDIGLWAEGELNKRNRYKTAIKKLIGDDGQSWSSGALPATVRKARNGEIKRWVIGEGTLTPTPAEPRYTNVGHLTPVKMVSDACKAMNLQLPANLLPEQDDAEGPDQKIRRGGNAKGTSKTVIRIVDTPKVEGIKMELTQEQLRAQIDDAIKAALAPAPVNPLQAEIDSLKAQLATFQATIAAGAGASLPTKTLPNPQIPTPAAPRIEVVGDVRYMDWTPDDMMTNVMVMNAMARDPKFYNSKAQEIALRFLAEVQTDESKRYERQMAAKMYRSPFFKDSDFIRQALPFKSLDAALGGNWQGTSAEFVKANELDNTGQTGFGTEYTPIVWADTAWRRIRITNVVAANMVPVMMPTNPWYMALEGADPTVYYVPETTDIASLVYNASNTISASKIATAKATWTAKKLAGRVGISREFREDGLAFMISQFTYQLQRALKNSVDNTVINGDTATGATTNVNFIDGTPATAPTVPSYIAFDGIRKLSLVTNTAQQKDFGGGAPTMALFRGMIAKLLPAYQVDLRNLLFVIDVATYQKCKSMPEFSSWQNAGVPPTPVTGLLPGGQEGQVGDGPAVPVGYIDGIPVYVSAEVPLTLATGKANGTTLSANVFGTAVIYHRQRAYLGYRRELEFQSAELPLLSDVVLMQAALRCTVQFFDTTSYCVGFNIAV